MSLEAFKDFVNSNSDFKESLQRKDVIDFGNGRATLYRENLMKEFEKFYCKDEDELVDKLYYKYGVFANVVD